MNAPSRSFGSSLLIRWYWALAVGLTAAIFAAVALAMLPIKHADGGYASHPYGLMTELENHSLDLLFQLRNVRHPDESAGGMKEPIRLILIDEASIKASKIRLQKWPRHLYARLVDRASEGGAAVIG